MKNKKYPIFVVYGALILATFFWGLSYIWSTRVFQYWSPLTAIFVRLFFSTILIFSVLALTGRLEKIHRKDVKWLILSGTLSPFLYFLCEGYGLLYTSSTICSVIISTIPVASAAAAVAIFHEKLSMLNIAGMLMSTIGVFAIIINPDFSLSAQPLGLLMLLGAVVVSVIHILILKRLCDRYNPFTIIACEDFVGTLLFLPLVIFSGWHELTTTPLTTELILMMALLTVFAGSLAFPLHAFGLRELGVSRSNIFSNFISVFTAIAAYFFLHESFTVTKIIGIVLVIFGVFLVQQKNKIQKPTVY